jgi:hypothetical protein
LEREGIHFFFTQRIGHAPPLFPKEVTFRLQGLPSLPGLLDLCHQRGSPHFKLHHFPPALQQTAA